MNNNKILIISKSYPDITNLCAILRDNGYDVKFTDTPREALALADSSRYKVIFCAQQAFINSENSPLKDTILKQTETNNSTLFIIQQVRQTDHTLLEDKRIAAVTSLPLSEEQFSDIISIIEKNTPKTRQEPSSFLNKINKYVKKTKTNRYIKDSKTSKNTIAQKNKYKIIAGAIILLAIILILLFLFFSGKNKNRFSEKGDIKQKYSLSKSDKKNGANLILESPVLEQSRYSIKDQSVVDSYITNTQNKKKLPGFIFFDNDSDRLSKDALGKIDIITNFIKENNLQNITVFGFTSDTGNQRDDMKLSLKRAKAVRKALEDRGISVSKSIGMAAELPLVSPDKPRDEQGQNNRASIWATE